MSGSDKGPSLHLRLDEIGAGGSVLDISGNGRNGTAKGDPAVVPDTDFGSTIGFDGANDYVEVPAVGASDDVSILAWVYADSDQGWRAIRNDKGWTTGYIHFQFLNGRLEFSIYGCNPTDQWFDYSFETGRWYHIAVAYSRSEKAVSLYVDGAFAERKVYSTAIGVKGGASWVGGWNGQSRYFQGKIAALRVYPRALSMSEVPPAMQEDLGSAAAFRRLHPVEFSLHDQDLQPVIYIADDPEGHDLQLEMTNTSEQTLEIAATVQPEPSAANHNLELKFRPGTISAESLAQLRVVEKGWKLATAPQPDGTLSIYLLAPSGATVASGGRLALTLQNVTADGRGGSRGTRIEIGYQAMGLIGADGNVNGISGERLQHLTVVNHQGRKNIPLHVGFVGSNTILNQYGEGNDLVLRITNTQRSGSIELTPAGGDTPSTFILSFDLDSDWALCRSGEVGSIQVWHAGAQVPREGSQGESPSWRIIPKVASLKPGEHLQIEIKGIVSSLPTGHADLRIHYENVPGYWDGQFVTTVEKGPLVERGNRVGIGVPQPRTELDLGNGTMSGAPNAYLKAQFTMSGGGTVTWGGPGNRLKWTQRFIAIAMERSATVPAGYINIEQPTREIAKSYVWNGVARSANASGVVLNSWEALYAVHAPGGNQSAVTYRIERYTNAFDAPSNWLLVAVVNHDDGTVKLGTGVTLARSSSSTKSSPLPSGTILMWSGASNTIPDGFALCNGSNGTPDLQSRFIVGAGSGGSPRYSPGNAGNPDAHYHRVDIGSRSANTNTAGAHQHRLPRNWYWRDFDDGGYSGIDIKGRNNNFQWTESAGGHSHSVSMKIGSVNSTTDTGHNRPKWYALCFIMKL